MRLGIDARLINGKRRGMGNVLYNILLYLHGYISEEIVLYFDRDIETELEEKLKQLNYKIIVLNSLNYFFWEQYSLPKRVKQDNIDIFWHPYNTGSLRMNIKQIVSIHDVMFMKTSKELPYSKKIYQIVGRIYRKYNTPRIANKAKKIITISKHAKEDINKEIDGINHKINVVYNGCTKRENTIINNAEWLQFKSKNQIKDNFLLCLGATDPRKNTLFTIKVFSDFIKQNNLDIQLVICGLNKEKFVEASKLVENLKMDKNVIFIDYVSSSILEMLYINAYIFLFLSFYEGFGLPILEAMSLGTPVLTTGVTSMPEIAGDAAIITSHNNVQEASKDLEKIFFDKDLYSEIVSKGLDRINLFSWDTSSKKIADIINSL